MKTKFTIAILALCMMFAHTNPLSAQNEIIIGEGDNYTIFLPFYNMLRCSWSESIYLAESFPSSCVINAISYHNWLDNTPLNFTSLKIYMGETNRSSVSSDSDWTSLDDLCLVYTGNNILLGTNSGWNEIVLDNPFTYENQNNLVIVVSTDKQVGPTSRWSMWGVSTSAAQNVTLTRAGNDNSYSLYPTGPASIITNDRPYIKLAVNPIAISCYKPLAIQVSDIMPFSVSVSWLPAEGSSSWDVFIGTEEPTIPVATVSTPNYTFTGLTSSTQYKCYVRTRCDDNEVSEWRFVTVVTEPDFIGEGTMEHPYLLYSKENLEELNHLMKDGWSTYEKHFKLMHDITTITEPIGGVFQGVLDGNGHTINVNLVGDDEVALFSNIGNGANIYDLCLNGNITGASYVAGIAARVNADLPNTVGSVCVSNCINEATINATGDYVGGIIGWCSNTSNQANTIHIINCTNKGQISTEGRYVGGITGMSYGIINNCENRGAIDGFMYCGGIGGAIGNRSPAFPSAVLNCNNKNAVSCNTDAGGIIGYAYGNIVDVLNCFNSGTISGGNSLGGIVGHSGTVGVIKNVYNAGDIQFAPCSGSIVADDIVYVEREIDGVYFLNGTCDQTMGCTHQEVITNCSSFTQDTLNPLVCTLDTMCYGSTDLRTALNNWREGNPDYREWLEDVYGYNGYFPTFDAGRPPGLEITPDPLSLGHRPIGARVRSEELRLINTGTTGLDIMAVEIADASFVVLDETVWNPEMPIHLEGEQSMRVGVTTDPEAMIGEGTLEVPLLVVWDGRSATMATVTATAYVPETPDVVETALEVDSFPFTTVQGTSEIYDNYNLPGEHADGPDAVYKLTFDREMVLNAAMTTGSQPKLALYKEDFGGKGYPDVDNAYTGPAIGPGNVGPISEWLHYDDGEYVTTIGSPSGQLHWGIQIPASMLAAYEGCSLSKVMIYNADQAGTVNLMLYTGGVTSPGTLVATQEVTFTGSNRWEEVELETPMPLDVSRNLWICCSSETPYIASACDYAGEPNSCWVSTNGTSWSALTNHGLNYTWMIRGLVTNQRTGRLRAIKSSQGILCDLTIIPGTYYLVASSTSTEYRLEINPEEIPAPLPAAPLSPTDGAHDITSTVLLEWSLGNFTTEYQLLFGTSYPPTEVVVDWTFDLAESYRTGILSNHTQYFWKVNARNSKGMVEGPVWGFTTLLEIPKDLVAENDKLYLGETLELSWNPPTDNRGLRGYNLYQDNVRINENIISVTCYQLEGLEYNMGGYRYNVTAVYDEGESGYSNTVFVRVSGEGTVSGHVFERDSVTAIVGANVTIKGLDEHGIARSYSCFTDEYGAYTCHVLAGQYFVISSSEDYRNNVYPERLSILFSVQLSEIDMYMREVYYPVETVVAEIIDQNRVRVQWNPHVSNHRSLNHYRVYRKDCYDENIQLVAAVNSETVYTDPEWGQLESGVYEYGVSCVYVGNRESAICWEKPRTMNNTSSYYVYACNIYDNSVTPPGWIKYDIQNPKSVTSINADLFVNAGDYCGDGFVYAFSQLNDTSFFLNKIDYHTGEIVSSCPTRTIMKECAYDYCNDRLYGVNGSHLYMINRTNGHCEFIGSMNVFAIVAMACDLNGNLYGIGTDGYLYHIDQYSGFVEEIGYTGEEGGLFIQSAGFNHYTGIMYWAGILGLGTRNFVCEVDINTGQTHILAHHTGEQTSWCIPYDETYSFQSPGESPIVWSNRLDKDMTASMGITVSLESGEDPTGTRVRLTNLSEPDMGHDWDVILDGTGCWSCSDFRKGTYTLQITRRGFHAVRIDNLSVQEDTSLSYVLAERLNGVENLHVSTTGWAQWEEQKAISQWLYYDNGQYTDAVSGSTGTIWGIMIPSSDLVGYEGSALTEVAIYDGYAGTYYLSVYLGGDEAPSELVHTQTFTLEGVNDWYVKALSRPVELDTGQNLWITFYNIDASYPATACPNTGDANGRWVSTDGVNWTDLASHGYELTWMIRGLVSDEGRDQRSLQHFKVMLDGVLCGDVTEPYCQHDVEGMVDGSTHTTSVAAVYSTGFSEWVECEWTYTPCDQYEGVDELDMEVTDVVRMQWTDEPAPGVLGTMVFRDGTLLTAEPLTCNYYVDANPPEGVHTYCVRVVRGEEALGVEDPLWYAMSCAECAMVDVTGVVTHEAGQVRVYPNPSLGELTVEAEGMRRVEVSNTLGQRVYDRELRSDHHRMDMSGLTPGVYTVTVTSAIGTTVHRVVLMR